MTIAATPAQLKIMRDRAELTYPEECCGLLLGTLADGEKVIVEVVPTENCWTAQTAAVLAEITGTDPRAASKQRSFSIDPRTMLQLQKQARDRGLNIIGIFHSHPDAPAIPSDFDRTIAWSEYSYIIVSVNRGQAEKVLSWTLDENGQFQSEPIGIADNDSNFTFLSP